jgi:hypothetical protein
MKATIFNTLNTDATLTALLTGGLYSEVAEISRQATPAAFSTTTLELLPCLLFKLGTRTTTGPQYVRAERLFVNIWLYQQRDEDTITSANDRIYALLHETCLPAVAGDTGAMWWLTHVSDVNLQDEDETLRARYIRSQYQIIMRRG